jgi:hypothetical protein
MASSYLLPVFSTFSTASFCTMVMLGHHLAGMKGEISARTEDFENSLLEAMAESLFSPDRVILDRQIARLDGQNHQDH